jgi:uncharacterized oxidoreductase
MIISHKKLYSIVKKKFIKFGVKKHDAEKVSKALVLADLKGHPSHGVLRSLDYINKIKDSKINLNPKISVVRKNDIAMIDGDWGFGQLIMSKATKVLNSLLKSQNIACVTVTNCNHIGRLSDYTESIADNKSIGICFSNLNGTSHIVSPYNGIDRKLSSNPICISTPGTKKNFTCDFATSSLAEGKIKLKYLENQRVQEGHLIDFFGKKTNNPKKFYEEPKGSVYPFGGLNAHKGYALSLAIDIISGALSGAGCSSDENNIRHGNAVTFIGVKIKNFVNYKFFLDEVLKLEEHVKNSRPLFKNKKIYFPGEPEIENFRNNKKNGIKIGANLLKKLLD